MDSSYLSEILNSEGNNSINVGLTITDLINRTNILKNDITVVVENQSLQFHPILKENSRLKAKAEELLNEMNLVETKIDGEIKNELINCTGELESLSHSLKEVNFFLTTLQELLEIDSLIRQAKKMLANKEYDKCAKLIQNAKNSVKLNSEKLDKIEVFKVLSQEVTLTYEHLLYKISEIWSSSINITTINFVDGDAKKTQVTLSIQKSSLDDLTDALNASTYLNSNSNEKKFSTKLLNDVLNPIILKKTNLNTRNEPDKMFMVLEILNHSLKPSYLDVFENIRQIVDFLKINLDIQVESNQKLLSIVGSYIAKDFADSLIKNYLSETIPSNSEEFNNYKDVVNDAEALEKSLQSVGFLPKESSSLMEYARNVNTLFANKFCQCFLSKAREIVKKDLHNMTICDEITSDLNLLPPQYKKVLKVKMNIQDDIFKFHKCQISKNADELVSLTSSIMMEVQKSMDMCAVRLFHTVRNIFEMYSAIVPIHHKKFLETLPQQVALFHNNCIYLAHNLIHIVTKYQERIPDTLKSHLPILLEEAIHLRSLAAEKLEGAVTNQRSQLVYILRDSGLATLNENPKLDPNSEKSIRQCIRQLQILQTVWNEVLPLNVYNRAIGFLIDALVEELISLIISVEDISSQSASDLVNYFTIILERAPALLPDDREVHKHVRKWQKFKEFVFLLKGSLRDIDDRWADGMGPLAVEFTPEQVKHMIRALFQNSDRRATLLARIR